MKYQAHQDDSVDLLCFRYYGRTHGVVEQVLNANPGLCLTSTLNAGQWVDMPDLTEPEQKSMIQLWD